MLALLIQKLKRKNLPQLSILLMAFAALLLTGCLSVQTNLALHGNGQWNGVQAITLAPEFVELMESEGNEAGADLSATTEEIDQWVEQAQSAAGSEKLNVTFNEVEGDDGSLSYVLQADGDGYEALNQMLFQGEADISVAEVDGQRRVTIRYDASQAAPEENAQTNEEMTPEMMELFGLSFVTRISGGQIISHNADRLEGNTAIWETPGLIEITLTEAAQFDPASVAPQEAPNNSTPSLATLLTALEQEANASSDQPAASADAGAAAPTDETTADSSAPAAGESTGEEASPVESADAPAESEQALPQSGAILPTSSSLGSLVLAGLILAALAVAGTTAALSGRK